MANQHHLSAWADAALDELKAVFTALSSETSQTFIQELKHAKRIALYGVGREGLMMRALAMRLFHLGLDAHVVGDMTTPPISTGDLLMVSAGPGQFSTVLALLEIATQAGARSLVITAQPQGQAARQATSVIHLPAQTMANDQGSSPSVLPMGSLYEAALLLFADLALLALRDQLGESAETMRARHTNLE